jgi:tetratricopeptide (TPR) repeat protein
MNAKELYNQGNYAEVINLLEGSKDSKSVEMLAYSYQKQKQWEKAMNCWNILIQENPENGYYFNDRGVCKFNLRFKHAMQDFNKAIELEPDNAYFYSSRAYVKDKIGDTEGSVKDYEKAHKLDPDDALLLNNLGLAEQKLGYTSKARERFKDSDDLLGIKTIDSRSEPESSTPKSSLWQELKKMVSSKQGFKNFLKEAGWIKK